MNNLYFDIETGPLPQDVLRELLPPFDKASVKCGNLKDADKIAAKLAEAESDYYKCEDAALDATTGKVVAIGYALNDGEVEILRGDEKDILESFWKIAVPGGLRVIGFNCLAFDFPFLMRRSWALGIKVPAWPRDGRYWSRYIIDLREVWQLGDRMAKGSLDSVSRHLGLGRKTGNGKDFAAILEADPDAAIAYLKNDVNLVRGIAGRIL